MQKSSQLYLMMIPLNFPPQCKKRSGVQQPRETEEEMLNINDFYKELNLRQ